MDIAWLMCECYVWPTYRYTTNGLGESVGRCGRCRAAAKMIHASSKKEALDTFYENFHKFPDSIGSTFTTGTYLGLDPQ